MSFETFYLRAPDAQSARKDIKSILEAHGIDPYKVALRSSRSGEDFFNPSLASVHESGEWEQKKAQYKNGEQVEPPVLGDHCIVTIRTDAPKLKSLIEKFEATDPKLSPSQVPAGNKQSNGTSRINPPATPIRPIATV